MITCKNKCFDVDRVKYFQNIKCDRERIKMVMISEAIPHNLSDYFDAEGTPEFIKNTNFIFEKQGLSYKTYQDYLVHGIYLTTAIKCIKKDYLVSAKTIETCSYYLEKELNEFKNINVILMMGDFAIKAINYIWKRKSNKRIIPAGATYKIRNNEYEYENIRFIPSYTQTGKSFGLEKSKVSMITEDVGTGLKIIK